MMRRYIAPIAGGLVALLVAVGLIAGAVFGIRSAFHTETQTCTVTEKERVYSGSGNGVRRDQRVYTEQCGTLSVDDSMLDGHFNSADTWAQIHQGKTYRMKTRGLRVGFFSMFPNIVEVHEVSR